MSVIRKLITQIENLNVEQLCEALEYNGYGDCVDRIRTKSIDGQTFLKLTEVQVSLWRLSPLQMRRLWSFIEHIRQNPSNFLLVPKKPIKVATPPISNVSNLQKVFQNTSPGIRPQLKQKPNFAEKNKFENAESKSENRKFSSLTKEDSQAVKSKLEDLFKGDSNSSFLHTIKPSLSPKPAINNYVEENNNDDDDDLNDGYLPPIHMEQKNLKLPPVENKNTFLNKTRQAYENHDIEQEPQLPARPNYKKLIQRPLPPIPREIVPKFEPPKFQNKEERPNSISLKPVPKTASIFKRPRLPISNERQKIETPEEEIDEYTPVLEEEPAPSKRPLPAIPIEDDEHLAEYGTISEEEEEEEVEELKIKHQFKPIDQHSNVLLSQLKSATNQKHKPNIVEEEDLVYEPVLDVIDEKEKFLKSRPLPPPPTSSSRPNQKSNEGRSLSSVPISSKRSNQRVTKKPATGSDSDEEIVLSDLRKIRKDTDGTTLTKPPRTNEKSKSPTNLPKPPMLPKPPQFGGLNVPSNNIFVSKEPKIIPKDEFEKETYYRETDRKGARIILKNLEEGTFLVRPSRDSDYICTLSIMHSKKMFNVGVQQDQSTGILTLGSMDVDQPDFERLQDIINYYCVHPLCLSGQIIVLKNVLPFERR